MQIKCNRLRPACEACQVFQCPCIYGTSLNLTGVSLSRRPLADGTADAVPKKRGPKTDVLEALLKRVDGLEARLKDKKADPDAESSENAAANAPEASNSTQSLSITTTGGSVENGQQESEDTKMFSPILPR